MKMTATRSPKFRKLMNRAGLSRLEAVGTLELLWLFTMEHAPAGDIGKWPDEDIELECEWDGKDGGLVDALVETGWLDECTVHRLVIHDWNDHLPEFLRLRVHRKTLEIVIPKPPETPQESPPGDSVRTGPYDVQQENDGSTTDVEREGKGREGKGREERPPSADSPNGDTPAGVSTGAPKKKRTRAKPKTEVPEELKPEHIERVRAWAQKQSPMLGDSQLKYGWAVYSAKAKSNGYRYVDHAQAFINALGAGGEAWALKGYGDSGGSIPTRVPDWCACTISRHPTELELGKCRNCERPLRPNRKHSLAAS